MPDSEGEATAVEILSDYECPECGPVIDPDNPMLLTEDEALGVLGGDERGFLRCPNGWCDEELEPTVEAALDMLDLLKERMVKASAAASAPEATRVDGDEG
jgi:hypothetical protein